MGVLLSAAQMIVDVSDLERWRGKVVDVASATNRDFTVVFRDELRLLMQRVIRLTPPHDGGTGVGGQMRTIGKNAVKRDISRAIRLLSPKGVNAMPLKPRLKKWVKKYVAERNGGALAKMAADGVFGHRNRNLVILTGEKEIADAHRRMRDSRGVVRRSSTPYATFDSDAYDTHVARKQGNVGMAKGGWEAAYAAVGGSSAEWIARHAAFGTYNEHYQNGLSYVFEAINRSPWSRRGETETAAMRRTLENALESRIESMDKKIQTSIESAVDGLVPF